ncbi:hypothetical protein E2C01_026782 [Portunus trituberculatus]|uniref:Uncharacterized protein n=1 Tax=Portunus trituberculatus TaxID=210409 RepID=A0A5B7EH09_PORTR|nr:hypothetical protein [Portunus trituberculatus]
MSRGLVCATWKDEEAGGAGLTHAGEVVVVATQSTRRRALNAKESSEAPTNHREGQPGASQGPARGAALPHLPSQAEVNRPDVCREEGGRFQKRLGGSESEVGYPPQVFAKSLGLTTAESRFSQLCPARQPRRRWAGGRQAEGRLWSAVCEA